MAKKNKNTSDPMLFFAWLAIVIAGLLLLVQFVFGLLKIEASWLLGIFAIVERVAFLLGVSLAGMKYAKAGGKSTEIIFWVAVISYIVFAILNLL